MRLLLDQFLSGGPIMWPILLCSVVTWAIIIERALHLRRRRFVNDRELQATLNALAAGDLAGAEAEAARGNCLAAAIIAQGIDEFRYLATDLETALTSAAERRLKQVWDHMIILNTGGRVAILLGLLGTVIGMVGGFRTLTAAGVDKQQVAADISAGSSIAASTAITAMTTSSSIKVNVARRAKRLTAIKMHLPAAPFRRLSRFRTDSHYMIIATTADGGKEAPEILPIILSQAAISTPQPLADRNDKSRRNP